MPEHPNVDLLRKGYEAFAKGDMATLREVLGENIVWHVPGNSPFSGEHRGRDAVLGLFARLAELSGDTYGVEVHDFLANDEHAVALVRATASRQGRQLDSLDVTVYHIANGKVAEAWDFIHEQRASDKFWS